MENKKVLMLGEYDLAMYHPMTEIDTLFAERFQKLSFDFTSDPAKLEEASAYDLIISYWDDWNTAIADNAANALEKYVRDGGKLLVIHNGISLQLQENLMEMIGAKFLTHPTAEVITFLPQCDKLAEGVANFSILEEPYQFEMVSDNKEIVLKYLYKGVEYPAGWKKNYGSGKVVYLCPGHTVVSFTDDYMKLIENSIESLVK